ncbi:MAG TPA: D-alanyl-D-alanine carboxypeptidase, partial [Myxococcaceae bacterium]|nr:D-alanyl-D-alanine carboxypeptidase [Myxococcaceae bacterium]
MRPFGYIAVVAGCLLAAPVEAGGKAADRDALRKALEDAVQHTALRSGRVSVQVVSLDDGSLVYAKNADDLLNPASNVKLFTAAAALVKLGSDFRFDTDYLIDADLKDGKCKT